MVVEYIGYTVPSDRAKQFERAYQRAGEVMEADPHWRAPSAPPGVASGGAGWVGPKPAGGHLPPASPPRVSHDLPATPRAAAWRAPAGSASSFAATTEMPIQPITRDTSRKGAVLVCKVKDAKKIASISTALAPQ